MLYDVKGEVVAAAETPNRDCKQNDDSDRGLFQNQQHSRKNADNQEQNAFGLYPPGIGQVFHTWRHKLFSKRRTAPFDTRRGAASSPQVPRSWAGINLLSY
jgi:hypothetical protein